jgi:hypothetical protein
MEILLRSQELFLVTASWRKKVHHRRRSGFIQYVLITVITTGIISIARQTAASDIVLPPTYSQSEFHNLSKEVGLAISYLAAAPAEPLGLFHFDAGVEASFTHIDSGASYWQSAYTGSIPDYLIVPKLRARVGLPFGIDIGAEYAYVPSSDIRMAGAEVKWAFVKGSTIMPALSIRGSYTTLMGVSGIDLQTYGADVNISKGIAIFTPYLGVGQIWINSSTSGSSPSLSNETISETRGFVGLRVGIPLISFVAEAAFSSIPTYTARLSVGF